MKKFRMLGAAGLLVSLIMSGCGGGDSPVYFFSSGTTAAGKVVAGPVSGATVFADRIGVGVEFTKDPGEVSTTTLADGTYNMTIPDGYGPYRIVSTGGTDTISNLPAITYIAPSSTLNKVMVSPFTTLIAVNPALAATLKTLLGGQDPLTVDTSTNATPAALFFIKALDNAVAALTGVTAGLSAADTTVLQGRAQIQFAQQLATLTATQMATPADLQNAISTALATTLQQAEATLPVKVSDPVATAANLAASTVATTTSTVGLPPGATSFAVTGTQTESSTFNPTNSAVNLKAAEDVIKTDVVQTAVPAVVATTPSDAEVNVNGKAADPVTVIFSKNVIPGSIAIAGIPVTFVSYDTATFTAKYLLNADLQQGTLYTVTISGAKDDAGNVMPARSIKFTTVAAANTKPLVIATTPLNNQFNVPVANSALAITFNSDINATSLASANIAITPAAGATFTNLTARTATYGLSGLKDSTKYQVVVSGVRNTLGQVMDPYTFAFSTVAPVPPPNSTTVLQPSNGAQNVPLAVTMKLQFNGNLVDPATISVNLGGNQGAASLTTFNPLGGSGGTAEIALSALAYSTTYTPIITARDTSGNVYPSPATYIFRTVTAPTGGSGGSGF